MNFSSLDSHLKPTVGQSPLGVIGEFISSRVLPVNRIPGQVVLAEYELGVCSPGVLVEGLI